MTAADFPNRPSGPKIPQPDFGRIAVSALHEYIQPQWDELKKLEHAGPGTRKPQGDDELRNDWLKSWLTGTFKPSRTVEARAICEQIDSLLETKEIWPQFLEELIDSGLMDRKCWFFLVQAFFRADFGKSKIDGLEVLRGLLADFQDEFIPSSETERTRWQRALAHHPSVLRPKAELEFFSKESLARSEAEALLRDIGSGSDSRFWHALILRDVEEVCRLKGSELIHGLEQLLPTLLGHLPARVNIVQAGLARFLERMALEPGKPLVVGLKNAVLLPMCFGHPSIAANAHKWSKVSVPAQEMMKRWISKWDLEQFFEILDAQGQASKDRLRFWKTYIDEMSGTQIVFGHDANSNGTTGFRNLRETLKKENRYCQLRDGASDNNAFVFQLRGRTFVEFGAHGKGACYVYEPDALPSGMIRFEEATPRYIDEKVLKALSSGHEGKWIHAQNWEWRFRQRIDSLLYRPVRKPEPPSQKVTSTVIQGEVNVGTRSTLVERPSSMSEWGGDLVIVHLMRSIQNDPGLKLFQEWAASVGARVSDKREKSGALWVDTTNPKAIQMLDEMGFRYASSTGGYWIK